MRPTDAIGGLKVDGEPMTQPALNRRQSRSIDQRAVDEYGMHSLLLMENAGRGLADVIEPLRPAGTVVICCGGGNNGGDGFVLARHLDLRNMPVKVLLFAQPEKLRGDAAANYRTLALSDVPIDVFGQHQHPMPLAQACGGAGLIVDALLGTGATGDPRPPLDAVIDQLNDLPIDILAVDIPSGLDCDTGEPSAHTIRASNTCTFVAMKVGFLARGAADFTGQVRVLDIGAPRKLVDDVLAEAEAREGGGG